MLLTFEARAWRQRLWACVIIWLTAFVLSSSTGVLLNDHYGRISPGRQIARYGELPFRDFFDPGYFLTEFSSAAVQLVFGDNLIGEVLLTSAFEATGTVLVFVLAWSASESFITGLLAAVLAFLSSPRAYDYDKVLFYPLGVLLCWRYVAAAKAQTCNAKCKMQNANARFPKVSLVLHFAFCIFNYVSRLFHPPARLWALAAGIVAGGLYRYDTAVYLGAAAVVAIAIMHVGQWRLLSGQAAALAVFMASLALPFVLFVQFTGGVGDALDQVITYARREAERTRISIPPAFTVSQLATVLDDQPPGNGVLVRWAPSVGQEERVAAEARYSLVEGHLRGSAEERTWSYRMTDPTSSMVRALIEDPRVEDTDGIDRARRALPSEPLWTRLQRAVPPLRVRILPGAWNQANADAFLYYLFRLLPLLAVCVMLARVAIARQMPRAEVACLASLVTLCVVLNAFVLRDPVGARFGGMSGPTAILCAWIVHQVPMLSSPWLRRTGRTAAATILALTVWSIALSADWPSQWRQLERVTRPAEVLTKLSASPPPLDELQKGETEGLVTYLRECTAPGDRVFITWFAPEIYYFAQRGFAGGMAVAFGAHWSEPRFESRSVRQLESQAPPLIVTLADDREFRRNYPRLVEYLNARYEDAGSTNFDESLGGADRYRLFIRRGQRPTRTHMATSLPCFA